MTHPTDAPLTAHTLSDLVELIPSLLGFHPADSVVVVVVEEGHVAVTGRVDLPPRSGHDLAVHLAAVWERFPHGTFVVVACTDDRERAWTTLNALAVGLPPRDGLLIHADGFRWYAAPDEPGTPYDAGASRLATAAVLAGHPVLASRSALADQLAPTRTPEEISASLARIQAGAPTRNGLVAEALRLVAAADAAAWNLEIDEATTLSLASHDPTFLDTVMFSTSRVNASARRDLWAEVVRQSVPGCDGYALAALGLAAWVCGQGALQVVCLERMENHPGSAKWSDVLGTINAEAVPPSEWPRLRASLFGSRAALAAR